MWGRRFLGRKEIISVLSSQRLEMKEPGGRVRQGWLERFHAQVRNDWTVAQPHYSNTLWYIVLTVI